MANQYRPQPREIVRYSITGIAFYRGTFIEYDSTGTRAKIIPEDNPDRPRWVDADQIKAIEERSHNRLIDDDDIVRHSPNGNIFENTNTAETGIEQD